MFLLDYELSLPQGGWNQIPYTAKSANHPPIPTICLFSPLSHLSALASKASHSLLSPLGAHTSLDGHSHLESVLLFDAIGLKGTLLKSFSAVQKANLMGGDELSVLDHELEALNRSRSVHHILSGVDKDLHCFGQYGCSDLYKQMEGDNRVSCVHKWLSNKTTKSIPHCAR